MKLSSIIDQNIIGFQILVL